eukprot:GHVN01011720.1.p1 GENE.GHVN01011720.1~~GHVN01011720.1.p1  ORF type:complete len:348 (+),score=50.82 GHVN01011720.1:491-1534(+)
MFAAPSNFPPPSNEINVIVKDSFITKNTFLHMKEEDETGRGGGLPAVGRRPRTESADAVLQAPPPPSRNIPETIYEYHLPSANDSHSDDHPDDHSASGKLNIPDDDSSKHDTDTDTPLAQKARQKQWAETLINHDFDAATSSTASPSGLVLPQDNESPVASPPFDEPTDNPPKTTVMLRNIPNKYTQPMILDVVNQKYKGLYDFFYLPIDFRNKCNVGYAFINFLATTFAQQFKKEFEGYKLLAFRSHKVCETSWGRVQGLDANIEHYRNSAVMSVNVPQYKPLLFQHGLPIPFPESDGPLPSVKLRPQSRLSSGSTAGNTSPQNGDRGVGGHSPSATLTPTWENEG